MTPIQSRSPDHSFSQIWMGWLIVVLVISAIFLLVKQLLQYRTVRPNRGAVTNSQPLAPVQFDFYKLLPQMTVPVTAPATQPGNTAAPAAPAPAKPETTTQVQPAGTLVLQISALRQLNEALHLRDQMRTEGYPTFIQPEQAGTVVWYRVLIGPFTSLAIAQTTLKHLKDSGINAIVIK